MIIRNGCLEDLQQVISIEQINFSEAEAASKKSNARTSNDND